MNYLLPERLDQLAREHVLGTLQGGARRRFARVVAESPAAARAVAVWQLRLAVLAPTTATLAPRPQAWEAVQRRLFGDEAARARPAAAPAATGRRAPAAAGAGPWGRWLPGLLPGLAAGAVLCVAVVQWQPRWLGVEPAHGAIPPSYVGVLDDAAGHALLVTSARRHGRGLTVRLLRPVSLAPGQVLQLWAWGDDGVAAVPVVAWSQPGAATLALPDDAERLFLHQTHLGVTVEDAAAATGAPAPSAFLAQGHCATLW
jgi:anti-sigma-K factor RskA